VRPACPELPPAAVALALRIRGHLHGLVSLEVYGHMQTQTHSPDKLFDEITDPARTGVGPHPTELTDSPVRPRTGFAVGPRTPRISDLCPVT